MAVRPAARRQSLSLQNLESRIFLATINVADFGARPNDGDNDRAAVIRAIDASDSGDTILFSGGTFDFSDDFDLPAGRNLKGQNGATIKGKGGEGYLVKVIGDNHSITNLTIEGGGLFLNKSGGRNTNVTIDYNVFRINTSGQQRSGITFNSGLNNGKITNNYFTGSNASFAIYGYNYKNLVIANNEIVGTPGGMHIDAFGNCGDLLVEQNYISGTRGMGMEFQTTGAAIPGSVKLVFQDNWFEKPNLSSNRDANWNSFALSLPLDRADNVIIRRNTIIAPERPDGKGIRIGFEVGGDGTIVEDNYVDGTNHVVAANDGVGSSSVTVRNNKFKNYLQGPSITFPALNRVFSNTNNGPNVRLSNVMEARVASGDRPGIGAKRYDGSVQPQPEPEPDPTPNPDPDPDPGPTPNPDPDPTPNPDPDPTPNPTPDTEPPPQQGDNATRVPDAPTGLMATSVGASRVNLFWDDNADNERGYIVERSNDGKSWTHIATLAGDAVAYRVTGLSNGDSYKFRVAAFNSRGPSAYTNTASATPSPKRATYLSDMQWISAVNDIGPVERDMSNGEEKADDGNAITMDGQTYVKGLGVHSQSEIRFALNSEFDRFMSDIGIDDESGGKGSVIFEVWADGEQLYQSRVISGKSATETLNIDVRGRDELVLIVDNAKDSRLFDHADWAGARLLPANENPSTPSENNGGSDPTPTPPPVVSNPFDQMAPLNLTAQAVGTTRVNLSWQDTSTNETGFKIERSVDGENWVQIASVGRNVKNYSDMTLRPSLKVFYRVRAYGSTTSSAYTNVTSTTTFDKPTDPILTPVQPPTLPQAPDLPAPSLLPPPSAGTR